MPETSGKMSWVTFLIIAVVLMVIGQLALGGWLLPRLGLSEAASRMVGTGIAGGIIGLLYVKKMRPGGA